MAQSRDAAAPVATAETPPGAVPSDGDAGTSLEDIIVTAQRREQRLIDVPISIAALNEKQLQTRGLVNLGSIANLAANVRLAPTIARSASITVAMRGSVRTNDSINIEPTVGIYVDGVYIAKGRGGNLDLADISSFEILRGPQGTLYGRNTLSGAINIVTAKPSGIFGGRIEAGYGNYDRRFVKAVVDLPSLGGLNLKISGYAEKRDGYVTIADNPFPGVAQAVPPSTRGLSALDRKGVRVAARYEVSPAFTADYAFEYYDVQDTPPLSRLIAVGSGNIFDPASPNYVGFPTGGGNYLGFPADLYITPNRRSSFGYSNAGQGGRNLRDYATNQIHALTLTYDTGPVTLKSISSYRKLWHADSLDIDGTPLPLATTQVFDNYKTYSQELQAIGKIGNLDFTAGLYYFHDAGRSNNPQAYFGTVVTNDSRFSIKSDAYAGYGQVNWKPPILDEKLTLTGGLRYSYEKKYVTRDLVVGGTPVITDARADQTFKSFTPTAIIAYAVRDDFNIYVKYARGFVSGGFNPEANTLAGVLTSYRPETVDSFEAGLKARFLDGRLSVNAAYFLDRHKNQQLLSFKGAGVESLIINAGGSRIHGLELEVSALPVDWFRLSTAIGTLHSRYTQFLVAGVDEKDSRGFPFNPKLTASVTGDLRIFKQDRLGELHVVADYVHSDDYDFFPYSTLATANPNTRSTHVEKDNTLDLYVRLTDIPAGRATLEASLYAKNLTNTNNRVGGIDFGPDFGNLTVGYYTPPRTYGGSLVVRF